MTKEKLAELLGIKSESVKQKGTKFQVLDITLEKIDITLWFEDIEIEFWRCSFKNAVTLLQRENESDKEPTIKTKIFFHDCSFKDFFNARYSVFEKNFECMACVFEEKADFSHAEFQGRVNFSISRFKSEVRFIKTKFQAQATDSETAENDFQEVQFEGKAIFDNAEFQGRVNFSVSRFKNEARFIKTKFQAQATDSETAENDFRETQFEGKVSFSHAEFQGRVNFSVSRFKNEARFIGTKFLAKVANSKNAENNFNEAQFETVLFREIDFKGRASFKKCVFKKSTFRKITFFQEEITFWESEFERVNLIDCIFPHQTNFDRCVLKNILFKNQKETNPMFQDVKFQDCVFKETNTFGEKVFSIELKPILTTNTFEGQFNIDHQYLHYEPEEIPRENISIWRDLFRRLKSNRLAHHNIIDASELHTQELYAREIELEEKEKQNKTSLKEKVEKWQLYFYRLTSDHHTDLAKIFNNVILLIALFGIFACATTLFTQTIEIVKPKINNIPIFALLQTKSYIFSELPKKIPIEIGLVSLAIVNFCGIYSYLELRKVVQEKLFSFKTIDILLVVCIACCLYYRLSEAFFIFFLCFAFVASYILCLQIQKFFITIFSYLVCVGVLILKPTLLLPFVGRFLESSPTTSFPAMQSLSVVYCILMFLMLFSLQKTARKNSIIPS